MPRPRAPGGPGGGGGGTYPEPGGGGGGGGGAPPGGGGGGGGKAIVDHLVSKDATSWGCQQADPVSVAGSLVAVKSMMWTVKFSNASSLGCRKVGGEVEVSETSNDRAGSHRRRRVRCKKKYMYQPFPSLCSPQPSWVYVACRVESERSKLRTTASKASSYNEAQTEVMRCRNSQIYRADGAQVERAGN